MKHVKTARRKGFTIIELIVVIAIVGILAGIGSPRLKGHLESARIARIKTEVKSTEFLVDNLLVDKGLPESWENSGTLPLRKSYDINGRVNSISSFDSGVYKVIDFSDFEGNIFKSRLKGYFVTNDRGKVYYIEGEFSSKAGNEIADYESFMPYYFNLSKDNINNLKRYDMVILEPRNVARQPELLKELRDSGTDTYGYESIVGVVNGKVKDKLTDDDYIKIDGEIATSGFYRYKYGDILSENYREALLDVIGENILEQGYDGVFFDTFDEINNVKFRARNPETGNRIVYEQRAGQIEFLRMVKERYPSLSIIQNRGFETYMEGGAEHIDAMVFENLKDTDYNNPTLSWLFDGVTKASKESKSVVLAISYEKPDVNYEVAKELNWIYTYYNSSNAESGFKTSDKVYKNKFIMPE